MTPYRNALAVQLFRTVFAIYLLVAVAVTAGLVADEYRSSRESLGRELSIYEQTFNESLARALWNLDVGEVQSIARGMVNIPMILGVKVLDHTERFIFAASGWIRGQDGGTGFARSADDIAPAAPGDVPEGLIAHRFTVVFPHEMGDERVGTVVVYAGGGVVFERIRTKVLLLILAACIKTGALWVIFLHFSRKLVHAPLRRFTDEIAAIGTDQLGTGQIDIGITGDNELKVLKTAFNELLAKLSANRESLVRLKDNLESQVFARTAELRTAKEFLQRLMDTLPDPLFHADSQGRLQAYNRAFAAAFGIDGDAMIGRRADSLLPAEVLDEPQRAQAPTIGTDPHEAIETTLRFADGDDHWVLITTAPVEGTWAAEPGVIGVLVDITERKHLEDEMRRIARLDDLTGALNRRRFLELAEREVARSRRYGHPMSLLVLDIDHLKAVNDRYGHKTGDACLQRCAATCFAVLRESDLFGRIGGEEFAVLAAETSGRGAICLAERLRAEVGGMLVLTGVTVVSVTVSIGVAEFAEAETLEGALIRADSALAAAKQGGRDRAVLATAPTAGET